MLYAHKLPAAAPQQKEDVQVIAEPIFLIGARGCGKTTVGQRLAETCHFTFIDTDRVLQDTIGRSIAELVAEEGWPAFRTLETQILRAVTAPRCVIATGGGIILADENRDWMRNSGIVVYLQASVGVLATRLGACPQQEQRPTLTGKPIEEEVQEVLAQRANLYHGAAHFQVDAGSAPDAVVAQILTGTGDISMNPKNAVIAGERL